MQAELTAWDAFCLGCVAHLVQILHYVVLPRTEGLATHGHATH